ncbi:MAG: hypothetical protein HQM08_29100 [Candidatus Riflebacteria bacterium]|nr:hypothetical protein [Candidatus Riflebacteria bacterium]
MNTVTMLGNGKFIIRSYMDCYSLWSIDGENEKELLYFINYELYGNDVILLGKGKSISEKFLYSIFHPNNGKIDFLTKKEIVQLNLEKKYDLLENEVLNADPTLKKKSRAYPYNVVLPPNKVKIITASDTTW